ncbi:MAG: hypothetical protein ONB46_24720 [candidate division KSB1 bacterium]|nr:hypothetical protein [candidate division KSB1 bacterium]MDZ7369087.1 hypothetical protein [candidate division KSB1 bacterium]MDZ7407075.1 hypothetical protein [candidate division KSB1 bacterium]
MPKLPGINHLQAVKALEKAGFQIVRLIKAGYKVRATKAKFPQAIFCAVEDVPARLETFVVTPSGVARTSERNV